MKKLKGMINSITVKKLKEICAEYDEFYGSFPEHSFEGISVFKFILEKLNIPIEKFINKRVTENFVIEEYKDD